MICSIDPGFKKLGLCVIDKEYKIHFSDQVNLVEEDKQKQNQTQYTLSLFNAIQKLIKSITEKYKPTHWIIEAQIAKFSATHIQQMLIISISQISPDSKLECVSPKMKLKEDFGCDFKPDESTTKYNQNKNKGMAICKQFMKITGQQIDLCRDIADAILMAVYYLNSRLKIKIEIAQRAEMQEQKQNE